MIKKFIFLAGAVLILSAGVCRGEGALKKASFVPLWSPQAQFAGYYVAHDKGIYKAHGLDVNILPSGPNVPPGPMLKSGKTDFALLWLSAGVRERANGLPVVNLFQSTQRSALILVARKSSGITNPGDLNGRKISYWEGDLSIQPKAFLSKYKIKATSVLQAYTPNLFLRGGVDAVSAMVYNEYHTILNSGLNPEELILFHYEQYGLNFPEDGIYAGESLYKRSPAMCRAFVEASLEGWNYAFAHEEEALDITLKYMKDAGLPANRAHQKWMLERIKELMAPVEKGGAAGVLKKDDYNRVASEMLKIGVIKAIPDFTSFYKPVLPR
ncbi:MAG: ABC transporter substrate-binding protein [Elusimicrobia bacterium]|nr:ABC transporter substrate-binding protein [Elusimicrobiota bacterium]